MQLTSRPLYRASHGSCLLSRTYCDYTSGITEDIIPIGLVLKRDRRSYCKTCIIYIAKMRSAFWLVGAAVPLVCHILNDYDLILAMAEASTREPVRVSSMITSTGSRAGIRHAHGFQCSSQPLAGCATAREPVRVPYTGTGSGNQCQYNLLRCRPAA